MGALMLALAFKVDPDGRLDRFDGTPMTLKEVVTFPSTPGLEPALRATLPAEVLPNAGGVSTRLCSINC
jgi:hypothetical protein